MGPLGDPAKEAGVYPRSQPQGSENLHFEAFFLAGSQVLHLLRGWDGLEGAQSLVMGCGEHPKKPLPHFCSLHQTPPAFLTPPRPSSSSQLSCPLAAVQLHQLVECRTPPQCGEPRGVQHCLPGHGPHRCRVEIILQQLDWS